MERKLNKTDRWMVIWVHVSTKFQFLFYGIHILTAHDDTFDDVNQCFNLCEISRPYFRRK